MKTYIVRAVTEWEEDEGEEFALTEFEVVCVERHEGKPAYVETVESTHGRREQAQIVADMFNRREAASESTKVGAA